MIFSAALFALNGKPAFHFASHQLRHNELRLSRRVCQMIANLVYEISKIRKISLEKIHVKIDLS